MPSFDNQIHNTAFLMKNKTCHKAILRINNNKILGDKKFNKFIIVIFFNHIIIITPKYIACKKCLFQQLKGRLCAHDQDGTTSATF